MKEKNRNSIKFNENNWSEQWNHELNAEIRILFCWDLFFRKLYLSKNEP